MSNLNTCISVCRTGTLVSFFLDIYTAFINNRGAENSLIKQFLKQNQDILFKGAVSETGVEGIAFFLASSF